MSRDDRGDGGQRLPGLGEALQPEAHELEALPGARPGWVDPVAASTEPLPAELARLEARVRAGQADTGWWSWRPALALHLAVGAVMLVLALELVELPRDRGLDGLVPVAQLVLLEPGAPVQLAALAHVAGDAALEVRERGPGGTVVALASGRAVFEVAPSGTAGFRVLAGEVEIAVTGTRFLVDRRGPEVEVAVEEGTVAVRWPEGAVALSAGERWVGPPALAALGAAPQEPPGGAPSDGLGLDVAATAGVAGAPARDRRGAPPPEAAPLGSAPSPEDPHADDAVATGPQEAAARAWLRVAEARDAGASRAALLAEVEAFLAAHPDSALTSEAELLRLELWSRELAPGAALAVLEQWPASHGPEDPRRPQVLLLHGSVAAGRAGDCARGRPSLEALVAGPTGALQQTAAAYLAACEANAP